jgi:hypothetical protein
MIARMWEVRAHPSGFAELLTWVCDKAVPELEAHPLHIASEIFTSTDNRIVIISKWRSSPVRLADPPERLIARSPHVWDFSPVDR